MDANACNVGTADGRVFFAKQQADGSLGAWTETNAGPAGFARSIAGHVDANGFIYVAGGAIDAPSWDGAVWFAKPVADGSIASWTQAANAIGTWIGSAPVMAVDGDVLYVGAGFNAFTSPQNSSKLFAATLDATTGQPGAWRALGDLPAATSNGRLVVAGGHAYLLQGANKDVYVGTIDADAGIGSWSLSPASLPYVPAYPDLQLVNGALYVAPGGTADVLVSAIQADGSLGPWQVHTTAPGPIVPGYQAILANGFYYVIGDDDCGADAASATSVVFTPFP